MQRTAGFYHQITDAHLPKTVGVVDDATVLHTAVDVLDAYATARDTPVRGFLRAREVIAQPWSNKAPTGDRALGID
jgi:hypothetical protein